MANPIGILDYITNKFQESQSKVEREELMKLFWITVESALKDVGHDPDNIDTELLETVPA